MWQEVFYALENNKNQVRKEQDNEGKIIKNYGRSDGTD